MLQFEIISSETCGCCKDWKVTVNNFTKNHTDSTYTISTMQEHPELDIKGLPFTIVKKNGVQVDTIVGNLRSDIFEMQMKKWI